MSTVAAPAWRRADADDAPLAWLWTLGTACALALAPFVPLFARLSPLCPIHVWTGVACPTCGSTRAVVALAALDARSAVAWNPLVALSLAVLVAGGIIAPAWVATGAPLPRADERARRILRVAVPIALAANWLYLIARGV